jgi:flagellar basal body P-ring formation protein FlgA
MPSPIKIVFKRLFGTATRHVIAAAVLMLGGFGANAYAQDGSDPVRLYLEKATAGLPGRVEVKIGRLDERLQLAPCAQVEPYVPGNARLWGKTQIGLRCTAGAAWNVFLPVEVKVFGHALVAARPIAYGQPFAQEDAQLAEVELSREPGVAVTDAQSLEGKTSTRAIAQGQILRGEHFRAPPAVNAGDTVRLVFNGNGFSVSASGRSLGAAADGMPVRVQTESGRVVQGTARAGRVVEMQL